MGNLCGDQKSIGKKQKSSLHISNSQIKSYIGNRQNQKLLDLKQFNSLTQESVQPFGEILHQSEQSLFKNKKISQFKILRCLGRGAFGHVYMIKDENKNKFYAMKIIPKKIVQNSTQTLRVYTEKIILQQLDHPFIVKLHYSFQSKNKLFFVVDLMPGGQLFYLIKNLACFTQSVARFYLSQILLGLEHMHKNNIIYRDLKPQNILLDHKGHIKLTDFGLSKILEQQEQITFSICGTPEYIAPQIILDKGYNYAADWYSFGIIMYLMLTGKNPHSQIQRTSLLNTITVKQIKIPDKLSAKAKSLLRGLLKINPKQRIGYKKDGEQIKHHPFFQSIDFNLIQTKKINPPVNIMTDEGLNSYGFESYLKDQSQSILFNERTMRQKGFGFDGFSYYKQSLNEDKLQYNLYNNNEHSNEEHVPSYA